MYALVISDTPETAIRRFTFLTKESMEPGSRPFIRKFSECTAFTTYLESVNHIIRINLDEPITCKMIKDTSMFSAFINDLSRTSERTKAFRRLIDLIRKNKIVTLQEAAALGMMQKDLDLIVSHLKDMPEDGLNEQSFYSLIYWDIMGKSGIITDTDAYFHTTSFCIAANTSDAAMLTTPSLYMAIQLDRQLEMNLTKQFTVYEI